MLIPRHLSHKPIYVMEEYNTIDGYFNEATTDARGLSIGIAQWDKGYNKDISAKVWRYTGEKWSRQSEELPLHRVLDLAIMICNVKKCIVTDSLREQITVQGRNKEVKIADDQNSIDAQNIINTFFEEKKEILDERLIILSKLLKELGY